MSSKKVVEVFPKPRPHWVGDGFHVFPVFGEKAFTEKISPFLMFDYAPPKEFPPTSKKLGVGQHPHRGFETVTLALQGSIDHADSKGHTDTIGPGDVQWMSAAKGIIHEEFHSREFAKKGGKMEMLQLWVNLPKAHKYSEPRYQPILDAQIPRVSFDGGYTRIISGSHSGVVGPAKTYSPVTLFHTVIESKEETNVILDSPRGHNALLFAARGNLVVNHHIIEESQVALLSPDGDNIAFKASPGAQIFLMGGEPLNEPIAARGPFVCNTEDELMQAVNDFYNGRF
eukprot:CAMPEP_0197291388 /NCGR_PEP_ID=MMETSP0890-20130614/14248_1 /TAXON_ID=44058 ORGANISM="Aureoumbra lagunensis, Strain CCMP1510" /NCGR_SAMPLE_ID=MMETSP0890 /ASSEMBLY_ACC=CAM_ASM_000533 /LENGTH=284 /DNA_ID=CAMNT_0042764289 /DNA_START=99 /DNA_END=953 /DNA_ORIENTATION=+